MPKHFKLLRNPRMLIDLKTSQLVPQPWEHDIWRDVEIRPDGSKELGALHETVTAPGYGTIPAIVEFE